MSEPPGNSPNWSVIVRHMMPWTFIKVRSAVGHGVDPVEAEEVGCEPGLADAVPFAIGLAKTGHFVRYALWAARWPKGAVRGIGDREIVAWAWHTSDRFGRWWIRECAEDFFHMYTAVDEIQRRIGELRGTAQESTLNALADRSLAAVAGPQDDLVAYRPGTACLSEALWLRGMREVVRTLSLSTDEQARRRVYEIADAGHHLAYAHRIPPLLGAILVREGLRDTWRLSASTGQDWILQQAESLGLRRTLARAVGRTQFADDLAALHSAKEMGR
ncbi:hypothetical protein [Streptomyces sp. HPF1205]|uniref:hypothetical protein n=1 Tax=Streptomyces sp. HPF1205 TaxID=2873262 RepID=UPI001CED3EEF|nr:hypothetical protein [Streptomyces sp. HPF1205]